MATTKKTVTRTIHVVLKNPHKVGDFITHAQAIHDTMEANAKTLTNPSPVLTVLQTHITDLSTKEAATKSRTTGAVADRDAALKVVADDLSSERAYVETLVNADPANAVVIAQDAGMSLRKSSAHSKPVLAAKHGTVSGTVQVIAKAIKGGKTNEWQYSLDGGKTWIDMPPTTKANTAVTNLTPGVTVTFRQRAITKTGLTDWSQPVSSVVV
jgi:hypothetical protein